MFNAEAIKELAQAQAITAAADTIDAKADSVVALPNDFGLHDLEKYLLTRRRARGTMNTGVIADFASYAAKHAEPGACVFVDQKEMAATAVLNLGEPEQPGHADNLAIFRAKATAAYAALVNVTGGRHLTQQAVAEFLEDWAPIIGCSRDGESIPVPKAVAAVRKITIEGLRRMENSEQQLSASRSAFEKIEATSTEPLPTSIQMTAEPYIGLSERNFTLRLGIITGDKAPTITLRIVNAEKHAEEMAAELATVVNGAIGSAMQVVVGTYKAVS